MKANFDMEKIYEKILHEVDVGIHIVNQKGETIFYNQKMAEMESMDREEVLHKNILDVFTFSGTQHSTLVRSLKTGKRTGQKKQTYLNNRGKEITTINESFPIRQNGKIVAAAEIAKDVTQLERVIKENVFRNRTVKYTFDQIIGESCSMKTVIEEAKRATRTSSSVLIIGETGTGKELFAESIHNGSVRANGPFISQNCAAIPEDLMEGLLFGTRKGAFTGAVDRPGLFEQADGGTLLLDEINSLSYSLQAKLLRVIQEKKIRRLGDTKERNIDVRIITTMNEDPLEAIQHRRLRQDLYYRLSVVTLWIPPLRERKEDIPLLTRHFIAKYNKAFQMNVNSISPEAQAILFEHPWPGNVRELEHAIEGAMNMMMDEEEIGLENLPVPYRKMYSPKGKSEKFNFPAERKPLKEKLAELEKAYIEEVLAENGYNVTRAAQTLGISRQSLQYRLKKFALKR